MDAAVNNPVVGNKARPLSSPALRHFTAAVENAGASPLQSEPIKHDRAHRIEIRLLLACKQTILPLSRDGVGLRGEPEIANC